MSAADDWMDGAEELDPNDWMKDAEVVEHDDGVANAHGAGLANTVLQGLDDEVAGLAAGAGSGVQTLMDTGSVKGALKAAGKGQQEGKAEHRDVLRRAAKQHPVAFHGGQAVGVGFTAPLAAGKTVEGNAARGATMGATGGVGFGDAKSIPEHMLNAYIGANVGGVLGVAAGPVAGKAADLVGQGARAAGPLLRRGASGGASVLRRASGAIVDNAERLPGLARGGIAMGTGGASEAVIGGAKALRQLLGEAKAAAPVVDDVASAVANKSGFQMPMKLEPPAPTPPAAPPLLAVEVPAFRPGGPPSFRSPAGEELDALLSRHPVHQRPAGGVPIRPIGGEPAPVLRPTSAPKPSSLPRSQRPRKPPPPPLPGEMSMEEAMRRGNAEVAQDWGTRARQQPPGPPPAGDLEDLELVAGFISRGATREKALEMARAVAKQGGRRRDPVLRPTFNPRP